MSRLFDKRAETAPSQYPRVLFHSLRSLQLLASVVVGGIMSYFMWHLTHDKWSTPWTFILLMASSLFSVAALAFTIILHCFVGLKPNLNLTINAFLSVHWLVSWVLLTWYMSPTLTHSCDIEHWREDVGIMICGIYKALFTFALLGLTSTLAALCLDFHVRRKHNQRGIYRLHDLDNKQSATASRAAFGDQSRLHPEGDDGMDPRESGIWERPEDVGPYGAQPSGQAQSQGYAAVGEGFAYGDTGYRGGHVERY